MTNPDDGSPADRVLDALGSELMRISRRGTRVYPGTALDLSAFKILWLLSETGPQSMKDLANELLLDQSTVSRQVKAAVEQGLVERYEVPGGAVRLLRPTPTGTDAYLREAGLRTAVIRDALDALGPERAAMFVKDLIAFNDAFDEAYARAHAAG